jgi:hypothetical protein
VTGHNRSLDDGLKIVNSMMKSTGCPQEPIAGYVTSKHGIVKVGIASVEQFKARTMAIARGEYKSTPDEPKIWFSSLGSFVQVLKNQTLLPLITKTTRHR